MKKDYDIKGCIKIASEVIACAIEDYKMLHHAGMVKGLKQINSFSRYNPVLGNKNVKKIRTCFLRDTDIQHLLYFLNNEELLDGAMSMIGMKTEGKTIQRRILDWEESPSEK